MVLFAAMSLTPSSQVLEDRGFLTGPSEHCVGIDFFLSAHRAQDSPPASSVSVALPVLSQQSPSTQGCVPSIPLLPPAPLLLAGSVPFSQRQKGRDWGGLPQDRDPERDVPSHGNVVKLR